MKTIIKGLLLIVTATLIIVSSAAAAMIEFPFADFQGTVMLDAENGNYYDNNVQVTSYTTADWVTHNSANSTDPIIGQVLNGNAFTGFHYVNGEITADSNAEFDFFIGDAGNYYLEAKARDLQIVSQAMDGGQYIYTASANLYDQVYHHTTDSLFMAQYMAASSSTNPQGQIFTWDFVIPMSSPALNYLVNVSGKLSPISSVPLPAAVWLFGSALAGLGLWKRQRS